MLISEAIGGVVTAIDDYYNHSEKLHESLEESVSEFESVSEEVISLQEQLNTCNERLDELQKLADNHTISIFEQDELDKLKEKNEEFKKYCLKTTRTGRKSKRSYH